MSNGWGGDPRGSARGGGSRSWHGDPRAGDDTPKRKGKKKDKGGLFGHGVLGDLYRASGTQLAGHFAGDVAGLAMGVVPGVYTAGRSLGHDLAREIADPAHAGRHTPFGGKESQFYKKVVKPTGEQYVHTYGPLLQGHPGRTLGRVYEHPLGPVLDALTIADLGLTGAARVGLRTAGRDVIETRSPRFVDTDKGPVQKELTPTREISKARIKGTRAARVTAEKAAGELIERFGGPEQSLRKAGLKGEYTRYGKGIAQRAEEKTLERSAAFEPYAKAVKGLSEKEWQALHIRARGVHPDDLAEALQGTPLEKVVKDPKVREYVENPSKRMDIAEEEAQTLSKRGEGLSKIDPDVAAYRPQLWQDTMSALLERPVRKIGGGPEPYYVPDVIEAPRMSSPLGSRGGGKAKPQKLGSEKYNNAILAMTGRAHFSSDVLGPEFLRRVKKLKYEEIYNALIRGAVPIHVDELRAGGLPRGWEFIRDKRSPPPTLRPETDRPLLPAEERMARLQGEQEGLAREVPNPEDLQDSLLAKDGFSTTDELQAKKVGDYYYIAPKGMVKAATGEFTRSSNFVYNFMRRPLSVWRALVLGTRVGFLTNNLVGNSLMYAVKTGGQGALRDLFGVILETHGPAVARKILRNPATPPELRESIYSEYFAGQKHGTFGRSQSPATSAAHAKGRALTEAARAATGAIPRATAVVAEDLPRTALIRHYIRKSPEFRKVYSSMPRQTRSFEAASRKLLEGDTTKAYRRSIAKQVNEALGDYLHMSPVERNVLRNIFPFYSWYRAIATTTFHLAADTPLRANILGQLGQIGKQYSEEELGDLPRRLEGAIGLGPGEGGTEHALRTQGWNPWATLAQLQSGVTTDVQDLGLNPFAAGLLAAGARHREGVGAAPLAGEVLAGMVRALPLAQLASPYPPSRLYPKRTRGNTLYSWLGVPIIDYSPQQAHYQAAQGK